MGSMFDELTDADWKRESPITRAYAAPVASRDGATLKKFIAEDSPVKRDPTATPGPLVTLSVLNFIGAALQLFIGIAVFVLVAAISQLSEVIPLAKVGGALFGAYFITWGIYLCIVGVGLLQRAPWGWCVAGVAYSHALVDKVLAVVHAVTHDVMPARIAGMVGGMIVVLGITIYIYKDETRAHFGLKTLTPVIICAAIGAVVAVGSYVVIMVLVQSAEALVPQNAG